MEWGKKKVGFLHMFFETDFAEGGFLQMNWSPLLGWRAKWFLTRGVPLVVIETKEPLSPNALFERVRAEGRRRLQALANDLESIPALEDWPQ